ncbi:MAG: dihydrofolate reductase family protein [Saprospiraceae bacterium]
MGKINVFNFITLNGFYKGPNEDISWHRHGGEENQYSEENANSGSTLLFGRITYEMMASFWPSPQAMREFRKVAEGMNDSPKIVFSKTLKKAAWQNTRILSRDIVKEIKKIKEESDIQMTILGSGSIVTLFAENGLIDDYQFMVDPVAIGNGTPVFNGMKNKLDLKLVDSQTFKSGVILLNYKPI